MDLEQWDCKPRETPRLPRPQEEAKTTMPKGREGRRRRADCKKWSPWEGFMAVADIVSRPPDPHQTPWSSLGDTGGNEISLGGTIPVAGMGQERAVESRIQGAVVPRLGNHSEDQNDPIVSRLLGLTLILRRRSLMVPSVLMRPGRVHARLAVAVCSQMQRCHDGAME